MRDKSFLKSMDASLTPLGCGVASMLRPLASAFHKPEDILIIRPGGMGDLVLMTLAAEFLGLNPKSFTWLIEKRSSLWAEHLGLKYYCYDTSRLRTLKSVVGAFKLVINSEQLFGLAQAYAELATHSRGKNIGFYTNRGSAHQDLSIPYDSKNKHEVEEFAALLSRALKMKKEFVTTTQRKRPATFEPMVAISGFNLEYKSLTFETWRDLVAQWTAGESFTVCSAPEDRVFAQKLVASFPGATLFQGNFNQLCERISKSEKLLSVDSAMVHIASYFGVPTTAIFTGAIDTKWGPLADGSTKIFRSNLKCRPCVVFGQLPPCPNSYECKRLEFKRDLTK